MVEVQPMIIVEFVILIQIMIVKLIAQVFGEVMETLMNAEFVMVSDILMIVAFVIQI